MSRELVPYREGGSCGSAQSTEDEVIERESEYALRTAIASLTPKQQLVVQLRFGFWDGKPYTQGQVAKLMRVSQPAVAKLEKRALIALGRVIKMDESALVSAHYPVNRSEAQMNTHKAHPSDWRQEWELGVPTLKYIGPTQGWYKAPPCEGLEVLDGEVVYVVHAPDVGKVKIGRTGDLRSRLSALRTHSPVHLEVARVYQADTGISEASLHARFADHRLHGEWFDDIVLEQLED